jgi:SOS response regulatory protein OraA/RecX
MSDEKSPRSIAIARLSAREDSAAGMRAHLVRKGVDEREAEETIADLVASGLVDDSRFTRALARELSIAGKGPLALVARLRKKGIELGLSEARRLLGDVSDRDENTDLRRLLERRYPAALTGDLRELRRAWAACLRRGFTRDAIAACLREPSA